MSKLTKQITAMVLVGMLIIGSVPGSVFAADADAGQTSEYAKEVFTEEETAEESSDAADAGAEMAEEEAAGTSEENVADTSEETTAQYYTVTLDANGGYFENELDDAVGDYTQQAEVVTKQVPVGGTVAVVPVFNDPDGKSMVFAGWSLERDGELVAQAGEEYIPVDNCTLYAVWRTEDVAMGGTAEQELADEVTEQADSAQESEEVEDALGDAVTAEEGAIEEDTESEANTDSETESKQDIVPDEDAAYTKENVENTSEEFSYAAVVEEKTQPDLIESSKEEENVREEAANGVVESGMCGDNLTWTLDEEGTLTISGTGEMEDYESDSCVFRNYEIARIIINKGVTSIGRYAFFYCSSLTSIDIPASVTSIGTEAFSHCSSLTSIEIPASVTRIGDYAFSYCSSLTSITIPGSVTSIGAEAFSHCSSLTSIEIPEGVTSINDFEFFYCSSLTSIEIPASVTRIGSGAFSYCSSLTSITIPGSVTSIDLWAFSDCRSLTNVTIPASVSSIGEGAFSGCTALDIIVDPKNLNYSSKDSVLFNKDQTLLIYYYNWNRSDYFIPETVSSIGGYAFSKCSSLTSITIPESVTSIGDCAFSDCSSLTNITIPESVTSIGWGAFSDCSSLTNITIPGSITSISDSEFDGCSSLTSIEIPDGVTSIGDSAFSGCRSLASITIPDGVTSIGTDAFSGCRSLASITILEGVTSIGDYTFYGCSRLTSITLPEGVTNIGEMAFSTCDRITSITIPGSVTSIDEYAFEGCESLKNIYFSGNAPTIASNAFTLVTATAYYPYSNPTWTASVKNDYGGTLTWKKEDPSTIHKISGTCGRNLTWTLEKEVGTLTISGDGEMDNYGVTGKRAPWSSYSIKKVFIKGGVTSIGDNAFSRCPELTRIHFGGNAPSISTNAFTNVAAIAFYPNNDPTWTNDVKQNYGGAITWADWNPVTGTEQDLKSGVISISYNSVSGFHRFYYDDLFFYADNKDYNNALAILTLGMELASFSAIEEDRYTENIPEESDGYTVRAKNIRDTYETLGFTNAKYYNYDNPLSDPSDKVAYSFATKSITNGTSNDTLVVIPIRGGGYGAEWASNFRVGASGNSYGFNEASKKVLADLKSYLQSIEINGNLKLWITGHSRAGATANLLTHYINKEASSGTFGVPLDTGDIYTYAFATPNCYDSSIGDSSAIDNDIFNIISANDLVPKIPLTHWGYKKYGQVKVLPEYSINRVASEFERLTGKELKVNKLASLWNGISDSLFIVVPDSVAYYYDYQEEVSGIFRDEFSQSGGNLASAFKDMLITMLKTNPVCSLIAVGYAGGSYIQSEAEGLSSIENMHYMEHYLSWLEFGNSEFATLFSKMPDDERITYNHLLDSTFNNNYKRYRIFCPVDVKVYSNDGELLVNIVDNEIVVDQLPCSVNGEEKSFYLLGDISNYHIELAGNDTGSMSYFVDEYNNQSEVVRSVYYYDIPLEEDIVYQADVSTVIEDEQEDYSVTDGEITTEKSLDTLTDSLESYSVEVENGGSDKAFAMAGEAVMLYADLNEDQELVRWESDDENVIFDDATSPSTFVKMPSISIKVRAVIKQKDPVETPTDLSGATVTIPDLTFNGKEQQVSISVVLNDNTLIENTDYSVDKKTAKEVGDYQIIITGIGNYEGTVTKTFTINPAAIDTAEISDIEPVTYTGKEQTPVPTVKIGEQTLKKDTDYTVSYANNTNIGTATVTITGKGNYTGTVSKTFTISAASIANATVSGISNKTYTGSALTQNPTVKVGDQTLTKDTDYTVSYANNTKVGTATVTITGKGNYTGTISKTFKISGIPVSNATVSGISNKTYTGSAITQNPTVKVGDKTLKKGTDYIVSYANNTNVGTATVTITGKGNYASKKTVTFKINKAAQSITAKAGASRVAVGKTTTVSITGNKGKKSYKSSNTAIATVTSAGKVTVKKVGTVKITATSAATANYQAASKTVTIKVVPAATASLAAANQVKGIKLTWKKVTGANGYKVYRGSTLIKTITSGSTVTFTDTRANTNGTKYTYKVVAKATTGDSTLSKSRVIYRVSRPAVGSVRNSASKKMTVKWGKNAKANGYQIQYSTDKNFKSGNKAVSITSASTVSRVIGSLTKGKTYYVRIRTYKTVGSTKYWSIWSAARSVKISK